MAMTAAEIRAQGYTAEYAAQFIERMTGRSSRPRTQPAPARPVREKGAKTGKPARAANAGGQAPASGREKRGKGAKNAAGVPAGIIRAWASQRGIDVPGHGRVPDAVIAQYVEAHR